MMFSSKPLAKNFTDLSFTIAGTVLDRVDCFKYLGIILDPQLDWSIHCSKLVNKVKSRLFLLKRLKPFVNRDMATTVYNSLIQSALDYCDVVWSTCRVSSANSLQRLQSNAAKTILHLPSHSPSAAALSCLSWPNLEQRRSFHLATTTYLAFNKMTPCYLSSLLTSQTNSSHNTRKSHHTNLVIPRVTTNLARSAFSYRAPHLWNTLPINLRTSKTVTYFKNNFYACTKPT